MTKTVLAFSLGFAGLLLAAQAGFAASPCNPRADVLAHLASKYGETRRAIGLASANQVMEIFANAESGTWTITVTQPDGVTCLVASGQSFEALAESLPAKGEPA